MKRPNGTTRRWLQRELAIRPASDECWTDWPFSNDTNGRPLVGNTRVSRAVLTMTCGPADGRHALHSCDVPACWNPDHLRWGTPSDNMRDAVERGRHYTPRIRGEQHHAARLTEEQVRTILRELAAGRSGRSLAREYGSTDRAISAIKRGRTWRHIPREVMS